METQAKSVSWFFCKEHTYKTSCIDAPQINDMTLLRGVRRVRNPRANVTKINVIKTI